MSNQGPKLYATKPKTTTTTKAKQSTTSPPVKQSTSSPPVKQSTSTSPPVKESFARRYKFLWPLLLTVNFTVGAYLFTRTRKKDDVGQEETVPPSDSATSTSKTAEVASATITNNTAIVPTVVSAMPRAPIPEDQRRELFKWILEEKRKVKARDAEEKKRIDEEKAILKQFIRAKSVPSL